jgi:O-antigen/teichoic acid export membrane protein
MMQLVKKILFKIGVDSTVFYALCCRGWQSIAGAITVLVIAFFFNPYEQGYYFTFSSLIAMQIFVELGLSYVLQQFSGHEKAHLQWNEKNRLVGEQTAHERLASLVALCFKWYFVAALLIVLLVLPIGYVFFAQHQVSGHNISWQLPWTSSVVAFSLLMILMPFLSIFEGCGKIKNVAQLRLVEDIVGYSMLWIGVITGCGLISASFLIFTRFVITLIWLGTGWRKLFFCDAFKILKRKSIATISWYHEIFPFQWKIALSWISGYFIFQLFNPILFAFHGPKVAGQMGLTITATAGIVALSMSWISTKIPKFCEYIAKKNYQALDALFFKTLWQSLAVVSLLGIVFVVFVTTLQRYGFNLGARFLSPAPLLLLLGVIIMNHMVFAMAAYLRAHKQEPLLVPSIVNAMLISLATYFLGKWYAAIGVASGYFAVTLTTSFLWIWYIFITKRREWHQASE